MNRLVKAMILLLLFAGVQRLKAPSINYTLDVSQGFHFDTNSQSPAGFITSMTIGSTNLSADLSVKNPTNASATIQVVAVLESESWAAGTTDPVLLSGRVSTANKQRLANTTNRLIQINQTAPPVQINFQIFDYDPTAQKFYEAMEPVNNAVLNGFANLNGAANDLGINGAAATDVTSPQNFGFQIGIKPTLSSQALVHATSTTTTVVKSWIALSVPPTAITAAAIQITGNGATLQSTVNAGGASTSAFFEYGTSPALTTKSNSNTASVGAGTTNATKNIAIAGLSPQTTYYYRAVSSSTQGRTPGDILSFATATPQFNLTNTVGTNGTLRFNFVNISNGLFSIRGTTNISLPITNWPVVGSPTETAPGQYQFTAPTTNSALFYRLSSP